MMAAKEISRQLRIARSRRRDRRNVFIDMHKEKPSPKVENTLRDAMARDRAMTKILRTSPFALDRDELRQRIRPSFKKSVLKIVLAAKVVASLRRRSRACRSKSGDSIPLIMSHAMYRSLHRVTVRVHESVAAYLNNKKRRELMQIEEASSVSLQILGSEALFPEHCEIEGRATKTATS